MTQFLRFETTESAPELPEAPKPPAEEQPGKPNQPENGEPDEETAATVWVLTPSGPLNLRSKPNGSDVLGTIPRLAAVKLLEEGNAWSYVAYNGLRGYAMTKFLTVKQPVEAPEQAEDKPEQPESTENGVGSQPEMHLDPTLKAPEQTIYALRAPDTSTLQLWAMCIKEGTPLASVPQAEQVEVLQMGQTWCFVRYDSYLGYCLTKELEVLPNE